MIVLTSDSLSLNHFLSIPPPLPSGPKGEAGLEGEAGARGEPGLAGAVGARGEAGLPGQDGQAGERGDPGPDGDRGLPGRPGEAGKIKMHIGMISYFYILKI